MRCILRAALVLFTAWPNGVEAHQLDEYLQATRIALARDSVTIELDLTPGIAIAAAIFPLIDRDGDLTVAASEIETYARSVLKDLTLHVDGRVCPLTLIRAESPSWPELRDGIGTIRIEAHTDVPLQRTGEHRIHYENFHRPDMSVYLANVLVPATPTISVVGQERDRTQRRFDLDVTVAGISKPYASWLALSVIAFAALLRRRSSGRLSQGSTS